jgi:hypothetical protein
MDSALPPSSGAATAAGDAAATASSLRHPLAHHQQQGRAPRQQHYGHGHKPLTAAAIAATLPWKVDRCVFFFGFFFCFLGRTRNMCTRL